MIRLKDITGNNAKSGDLGIEVEVESKKALPHWESSNWAVVKENSLRFEGYEFISKSPFKADEDLINKLDHLVKFLSTKGDMIHDSPRTSVHVHCNVSRFGIPHIYNCVVGFWLFENLLARYCGEDREGNLFCLRLKDAEAVLDYWIADTQNVSPFRSLGDKVRYAGLNTSAIQKYGSLEVRLMRGSLDTALINRWALAMHGLFQACQQFQHPGDLFDKYIGLDKVTFMQLFFDGPFLRELRSIRGWEEMIDESAADLVNFAYCADWPKFFDAVDKKYTENPTKKKVLGTNPSPANLTQWLSNELD